MVGGDVPGEYGYGFGYEREYEYEHKCTRSTLLLLAANSTPCGMLIVAECRVEQEPFVG